MSSRLCRGHGPITVVAINGLTAAACVRAAANVVAGAERRGAWIHDVRYLGFQEEGEYYAEVFIEEGGGV